MGIEKKVYSFRLDDDLMTALKSIAEEQNRNLSNLVETVLKQYINVGAKKPNNSPSE